jgi:hypothetical protein
MTFAERILAYLDIPIPSSKHWQGMTKEQRAIYMNKRAAPYLYEHALLRRRTSAYEIAYELFNGDLSYHEEILSVLNDSLKWHNCAVRCPLGPHVSASTIFKRIPPHIEALNSQRVLLPMFYEIDAFLDVPYPRDFHLWMVPRRIKYRKAGEYTGTPRNVTAPREIIDELYKGNVKLRKIVRDAMMMNPKWEPKHEVSLGKWFNNRPGFVRKGC